MKNLKAHWLSGNFGSLGIVTGEDAITGKKKAYIGQVGGFDEEQDIKLVAEQGSPLLPGFLKEILMELGE